jgi:hypothetical protein
MRRPWPVGAIAPNKKIKILTFQWLFYDTKLSMVGRGM